jgi:Ca2+-transporting ATPase
MSAPLAIEAPHAASAEAVLAALGATRHGLSEHEVEARRRRFGPNRLRELRRRSAWSILADQFESLLVALLAAAAALSFAFGRWVEGLAIGAVLAINGVIGFASELRAVRSMEALRLLGSVRANVRRDGTVLRLDAAELVPGDLVVLEGGDVVTADLRVVESSRLQVDESLLTGESLPVGKRAAPVAADALLAERSSMLFKGTAVTRGAGEAVVVGTGMETELGRISRLVESAEEEVTPLEKRLDQLGQRLIWVTLAVSLAVITAGLAAGKDWLLMLETGIALAVATVPEGLPIIATLALARGMRRMAQRNALVNRLSAVETLGATGVIFSDKTGTLTENRMRVLEIALDEGIVERGPGTDEDHRDFRLDGRALAPPQHAGLRLALELGVLCNDASLAAESAVGDPLEIALLLAGRAGGIERRALLVGAPEEREVAFDPAMKMMATVHRADAGHRIAVKGAPEAVLSACTRVRTASGEAPLDDATRADWEHRAEKMAARGLRVLGLATRVAERADAPVYEQLVLVGLVGLLDPPRVDVAAALAACRRAGLRVVMVTGDHPATALNIARAVGLVEDDDALVVSGRDFDPARPLPARLLAAPIFARISPEQKLALIVAQQQHGSIVAMTGDGVNDAPALKKADIGIAMGRRGTEVARQASDIVLRDDAFGTIVAAIQQGRIIFGNIRAFVLYLISCNISEILIVGLATVVNAPLPILPLQILFLNLVTDVFPALALGVGEGDPHAMTRPPRDPRERVLEPRHWRAIAGYGALITAAVLGALALALRQPGATRQEAVTVSFLTLAFAQVWHVFNMHGAGSGPLRNEVTRNIWVWGAVALCTVLIAAAVYVPPLATLLEATPPSPRGWGLVAALSVAPLGVGRVLAGLGIGPFRVRAAGASPAQAR